MQPRKSKFLRIFVSATTHSVGHAVGQITRVVFIPAENSYGRLSSLAGRHVTYAIIQFANLRWPAAFEAAKSELEASLARCLLLANPLLLLLPNMDDTTENIKK